MLRDNTKVAFGLLQENMTSFIEYRGKMTLHFLQQKHLIQFDKMPVHTIKNTKNNLFSLIQYGL